MTRLADYLRDHNRRYATPADAVASMAYALRAGKYALLGAVVREFAADTGDATVLAAAEGLMEAVERSAMLECVARLVDLAAVVDALPRPRRAA